MTEMYARLIRQNIRNAYLVATLEQLEDGQLQAAERGDAAGVAAFQEMIDACHRHNVKSHAEVPG